MTRITPRLASALLCSLLFATAVASVDAAAGQPSPAGSLSAADHRVKPRAVAERIAALIDANYFDPAQGKAIADQLRTDASNGSFDAATDPRNLASILTDRLRPIDAHFAVAWSPQHAAEGSTPGPLDAKGRAEAQAQERLAEQEADRRLNYGFHTVSMLPAAVGYIDMSMFADFDGTKDPQAAARRAADAAMTLTQGADALIIDLRDNGGGSPAMVGYLASYFLPEGADVYNTFKSRGPDSDERPTVVVSGRRRLQTPLYILTSARTGSAAESFAYTLQAAKRAVIVGEASGGAANPGETHDAGDGFSVFISIGRPINPITHANWEGAGVKPDIPVKADQALVQAQILALQAIGGSKLTEPAATENRWALEALQARAEGRSLAPEQLAQYAGGYGSRVLAVEDGRLVIHNGRRPAVALQPLDADLFDVAGLRPSRVQFERDASGRVAAFVVLNPDGSQSRRARDAVAGH